MLSDKHDNAEMVLAMSFTTSACLFFGRWQPSWTEQIFWKRTLGLKALNFFSPQMTLKIGLAP